MTKHRIVLKWELDEDTSFTESDDCLVFEHNYTDREFASQLDILGTYNRLIKIGGCSPEQARQQTSYAYKRLREWHRQNGWNYVGCVATLYEAPDNLEDDYYELSDWIEVHRTSLWGINSDCGDYRLDVEREQLSELASTCPDLACTFTWAGIPGDPGIFTVEGERIEIEEHEDSWYMEQEMDSDLLPEWSIYFELRSKGDSKLEWYCVNCGETFDEDELTADEVAQGRCPNEDCERYHYKYVSLETEDSYVAVLYHEPGRTNEDWEQVLAGVDAMPKSVINHWLDTYASQTGSSILASVPTYVHQYAWYSEKTTRQYPWISWEVGGTK